MSPFSAVTKIETVFDPVVRPLLPDTSAVAKSSSGSTVTETEDVPWSFRIVPPTETASPSTVIEVSALFDDRLGTKTSLKNEAVAPLAAVTVTVIVLVPRLSELAPETV